ncbi:ASCH domain-containing protein [Alkalibacterium sp. f15]|uniref:ASCH domain-containing protein n=1 Tax=Alkalibacterium sp. f15 TaxID=3414029 RepID=UPI003BF850FC
MHYFMGLYDRPFELMASGKKTVEVRLNDEKRRKLSVGDFITFSKLTDPFDDVTVRVNNLTPFPTFKEMYETIPARDLGSHGKTVEALLERTYALYAPEKEKQWGTLAIEIGKQKTD